MIKEFDNHWSIHRLLDIRVKTKNLLKKIVGVEYGEIFIFWTRWEDSVFMQTFDIVYIV